MEQFNLLTNSFEALYNELKTAGNQLTDENKAFFKAIVENSTNFMAVAQDYKYVFVNSAGLRLLCCKNSADIIGKKVIETIHPDCQGPVADFLAKASVTPNTSKRLKITRFDGTAFDLETYLIPFVHNNKAATLIIGRNISTEIVHKADLLLEEKLRTDILNAFKEVIAFYTPNHHILWLNDAGKKQLNITDDSYIGKRCYKVWFNSNKPCTSCPIVSRSLKHTERLVTLEGNRIWKVRHTPLYTDKGDLTGFIEFRADVTDDILKEKKQKKVAADALYLNQRNSILSEIESVLTKTLASNKYSKSKKDFKKIFDIIDSYKQLDKDWKMLIANFEEVHPGFFHKLKQTYPLLSSNDIKHCACIRMNFDTKEIARFFNIKASSVQIGRVRLKKKMNLSDNVDLRSYILNF